MKLEIAGGRLSGQVQVPASKSASHRALLCAAMCEGESRIHGLLECDDTVHTTACIRALGGRVDTQGEVTTVSGPLKGGAGALHCGESGSTLRFFMPIAGALGGRYTFTGEGRLLYRPGTEVMEALSPDVEVVWGGDAVTLSGKLKPGLHRARARLSSQHISGLLMALPLIGEARLFVEGETVSQGYVDMTLSMMNRFGVRVQKDGQGIYSYGGQYRPQSLAVEGDWSQAAFFLVMGALGEDVRLKGLQEDTAQGDSRIVEILGGMGYQVTKGAEGYAARPLRPRGAQIDASDVPDLVPALAALAAVTPGTTRIRGAARLRGKESDRLAAMQSVLSALGGNVRVVEDGLDICGVARLHGGCVDSHGDHRIAMAAASILSRVSGRIEIASAECVKKSYPDFWNVVKGLGAEIGEV